MYVGIQLVHPEENVIAEIMKESSDWTPFTVVWETICADSHKFLRDETQPLQKKTWQNPGACVVALEILSLNERFILHFRTGFLSNNFQVSAQTYCNCWNFCCNTRICEHMYISFLRCIFWRNNFLNNVCASPRDRKEEKKKKIRIWDYKLDCKWVKAHWRITIDIEY